MALIKPKMTPIGIECSYWRIGYLSLDKLSMYGSISLNLFYDRNAAQYIDTYTEVIDTPQKFIEFFGAISLQHSYKDIYNAAYEFVKKYSEYFKDAEMDADEFEIDLISPTGSTNTTGSTGENSTGSTNENTSPTGDTNTSDDTTGSTNTESPTGDTGSTNGTTEV